MGDLHSVIVELQAGALTYQYRSPDASALAPPEIFYKGIQPIELGAWVRRLVTLRGVKGGLSEVCDFGSRLYDQLIPSELAQRLSANLEFSPYAYPGRAFLALYLDPSLSWIPWELLFDGKTFLCERFNFSRRLVEKSSSEKRSARRTLSEWPWGRGILILYGDVQGLSATAEKSAIEDITHAARHLVSFNISKTAAEALELLQQGYDICHYIGHAVYDGASLAASGWRFGDGSILSAADLGRASSQASFPRLIFANSFFSARQTGNAESHITTMHRAFLNNGVSHYIGTTNNVPNASSVQFSSSFYSTLLAGVKVGAALCWARDTLRRSTQSSWMCYVAYGNPKDGKAKIRVNDLARELEVKSKAVL